MSKLTLTKKYGAYPKYKDSGVDWFGEIPKDWQVKISKRLFREINLRGESNLELASVTQNNGVVLRSSSNLSVWNPGDNISGYKTIKNGQFVLSLRSFEGGVELSNINALVSPAYTVMALNKKCDKNYFRWLLKSDNIISALQIYTRGIRQGKNISFNDFSKIYLTIPDFTGQKKIADFLDEKTATIDNIIEKKKQQIELLKEKRTSLISQEVDAAEGKKGKLKNFVKINPSRRIISGVGPKDLVSFVPMEALSETGELTIQERQYSDVKSGFTHFENNDVVLAKITPCFENGKAGVIKNLSGGFGFGTTEFIVLRPLGEILPQYLYYIVFSNRFRSIGEIEMKGSAGQKRVPNSYVKNFEFSLPALNEQKRVIGLLDGKMSKYDAALNNIEKGIHLLEEFKSSLISHAVTGKIKI